MEFPFGSKFFGGQLVLHQVKQWVAVIFHAPAGFGGKGEVVEGSMVNCNRFGLLTKI